MTYAHVYIEGSNIANNTGQTVWFVKTNGTRVVEILPGENPYVWDKTISRIRVKHDDDDHAFVVKGDTAWMLKEDENIGLWLVEHEDEETLEVTVVVGEVKKLRRLCKKYEE